MLISYLTSILPSNKRLLALENIEEAGLNEAEVLKKMEGNKDYKGLKMNIVVKKEVSAYNVIEKKPKKNQKGKGKAETEDVPKTAPKEDHDDPNAPIIFDIQIRQAFTQLKVTPPSIMKELEPMIVTIEGKKKELEAQVASKEEELKKLRETAEKSVPTIEELKLKFKDAPTRDERFHKGGERREHRDRGTRGGHKGHDKKHGQHHEDKHQDDELPEEEPEEHDHRKHQKYAPKLKTNLNESDFPQL